MSYEEEDTCGFAPSEIKGSVGHGNARNVLLVPHSRLLHLHVHPVLHLARCL
jgi:hypothetical protein